MAEPCPFCSFEADRVVSENQLCVALLDGFPVSEGHALVVPRRHVDSAFDMSAEEMRAAFELVGEVRTLLRARFGCEGFNIGVNDGVNAGQTVSHAHIHVIPRYPGDVEDPRGGVRWVIPHKAAYWR